MSTPIFVDNKVVGKVEGDVLIKRLNSKIHFLVTPPAIANDLSVLDDAEAVGAKMVHIIAVDTGKNFWAPISTIREDGFPVNRWTHPQIALPLSYWTARRPNYQPKLV